MKRMTQIMLILILSLSAFSVSARDLSKEDIVCALDPKCAQPLSRSMWRGVTSSGGSTETPFAVDLYVNFSYDSANLTSDARITLDRLGSALRDRRLDGFAFLIAGHTDAKGSAEYNQKLSERRAEAVRFYLVTQHGIRPERLSARGYGKSQLLDPTLPEGEVNRRVQVVNMTASSRR